MPFINTCLDLWIMYPHKSYNKYRIRKTNTTYLKTIFSQKYSLLYSLQWSSRFRNKMKLHKEKLQDHKQHGVVEVLIRSVNRAYRVQYKNLTCPSSLPSASIWQASGCQSKVSDFLILWFLPPCMTSDCWHPQFWGRNIIKVLLLFHGMKQNIYRLNGDNMPSKMSIHLLAKGTALIKKTNHFQISIGLFLWYNNDWGETA